MNLQDIIKKYEDRNKSRLKSYKETNIRELLSLYVETEDIIEDLKQFIAGGKGSRKQVCKTK